MSFASWVRVSVSDDPPTSICAAKRVFDVVFCLLTLPIWLPCLGVGVLAVLLGSGPPILYLSERRFHGRSVMRIAKLRTMVRGADVMANRRTVPIRDQRFLNIERDSTLYTRVGRLVERLNFTELPQFFHVLSGKMSVIGNRPLPEDVVGALVEVHPNAERRFLTPAGLTGPAQLVGRYVLSDADRLAIETAYCEHCLCRYRPRLDLMMTVSTVLILATIQPPLTPAEVLARMREWSAPRRLGRHDR